MKMAVCMIIFALLAALLCNVPRKNMQKKEDIVLIIEGMKEVPSKETTVVRLQTEKGVQEIPLEEYLAGVVLTEMLPTFHQEALKAQAVAARTYALRSMSQSKHQDFDICSDPSCCQAWRSDAQLRLAFGENYDVYIQKGRLASAETAGEVLLYDGELIEALYHSCSGGKSEPAVAVWGSDVPYLQSVLSPGEEDSGKYCTEKKVPFSVFKGVLTAEFGTEQQYPVIPQDWIGEIFRSSGGGVIKMELAGHEISGTKVRSLFGLPSTCFQIEIGNGQVVFTSYGYGHRVGMSQYGAEAMAENGAGYREILQHYYTDVSIKKLSR